MEMEPGNTIKMLTFPLCCVELAPKALYIPGTVTEPLTFFISLVALAKQSDIDKE
jgi:hypothetical protein